MNYNNMPQELREIIESGIELVDIELGEGLYDEWTGKVTEGWGYIIWNLDGAGISRCGGFCSEDAARKAAEKWLNNRFGKNKWAC